MKTRDDRAPLSETLPGTWELISRIDVSLAGERRMEPTLGEDPVALLYYDRSGHFAAQFMKRDRVSIAADTEVAAVGGSNSRAIGGYDAYFGTYTVDDRQGTVTQRLVGALANENVGATLMRGMTVQGDVLTIRVETTSASGEAVSRTLTWRRVG